MLDFALHFETSSIAKFDSELWEKHRNRREKHFLHQLRMIFVNCLQLAKKYYRAKRSELWKKWENNFLPSVRIIWRSLCAKMLRENENIWSCFRHVPTSCLIRDCAMMCHDDVSSPFQVNCISHKDQTMHNSRRIEKFSDKYSHKLNQLSSTHERPHSVIYMWFCVKPSNHSENSRQKKSFSKIIGGVVRAIVSVKLKTKLNIFEMSNFRFSSGNKFYFFSQKIQK